MLELQFDLQGVMAEGIGAEHGISAAEWAAMPKRLAEIHATLLTRWDNGQLAFAQLPFDAALPEQILTVAANVRYRFDNLIVLGVGGSALGAKAMAHALLNPIESIPTRMERRGTPRLFICDNIDPDTFGALISQLDWKATCVNVISKSGKTSETAAQFIVVRDLLEKRFGSEKWKEHVVVTTDPASGPLRAMVICDQLRSFPIPPTVGGRYSVLSAVGLFPAACVGIDIRDVIAGARAVAESLRQLPPEQHPLYQLAAALFLLDTKRAKTISVLMPYAEGLQRFTDWFIQLWSESLGKNGCGQTPLRAIGSTDQHAQLQLFMDGPNNKVINIITVGEFRMKLPIPATREPAYTHLVGHDLGAMLQVEAEATAQALQRTHRPVVRWRVPRLNAQVIGQLIFACEWLTVAAAELCGVNPFDQPAVELGKQLTRDLLAARAVAPS